MSERILDLIEAFSERRTPLVLSELAAQIGAPKSSCFELVQVLKKRGYVYALGRRRGFYPTRRFFMHAKIIADNDPLLGRLDGMVKNLRNATGETVIVGKRQDDEVVYLDVVEGPHNIRYSAAAGDRKPLHSSAIGKAMLGQLDERQLAALLDRLALEKITPETIVERGALASDIAAGRARGYFVTRGENVADVMACARTIDFAGVSYGIAVAGPLPRMQMAEGEIAAALLAACGDIDEVA